MTSQKGDIMEDLILIAIYAALFSVTSVSLFIYFKRLRESSLEYKRAKNVIDDIILSFNRDLQKQDEKIQEINKKYELISAERNKRLDEIEAIINDVKGKIRELKDYKEAVSANYESLKSKIDELTAKYNEILKRLDEIERFNVERFRPKERTEVSGRSSPIIVGRDEVLASLTKTELRVLRILAEEGEKTVPEIRSRINLTREHTARLMKSLYMRGYVDRKDDKIPYVYRLNKKMEEILRKEEMQK